MKKHLSVFGLFVRSSIFKILIIAALMSAVELLLFHLELTDSLDAFSAGLGMPTLERVIEGSSLSLCFKFALLLTSATICLPGCNFKSNPGYTLRRLSIDERTVCLHQAIFNMLCYVILAAIQLAAVFGMCRYYTAAAPAEYIGNQTIFLAFYRNEFLHTLLPLNDIVVWIRNILLALSLGTAAAEFTYKQRRRKLSIPFIALAAYTAIRFECEIGSILQLVFIAEIAVIIIAMTLYTLFRTSEEQNDNE